MGVACSGGRDSTALLHATVRAAVSLGVEVVALHVHHGLLPEADGWWRHLQARCARWRRAGWPVQFIGARLQGSPAPGDSIEAWARRERYRALTALAKEQGVDLILLAHHRRDQAETVLLQALRGAGPAGLSAMPRTALREGITWARPWLDQPREAVEAYLRRHRLTAVEDPSNADPRYARSRLRAQVWPAFKRAFPQGEVALAGCARRMQEAQACLAELASDDASVTVVAGALDMVSWAALSNPRRANLLRHWAVGWSAVGLPDSLIARLLAELPGARSGNRWPAPGGWLQLRRGRLRFEPESPDSPG
jgi:tRNA(Ile)-lysidine synthase